MTARRNDAGAHFSRCRSALVVLVLTTAVVFVYWPVKDHEFIHFDDAAYITENVRVTSGVTLENLRWALVSTHAANWHPVTWISHMLDYQLFGADPGPHHLMNLFFHLINTLLVYAVLKRMTSDSAKSAFVAALFGLHPLHVESVAWAAERKDLLCALFWMLTLRAYVQYTRNPGRRTYLRMVVFFVLGLMSKPMIVTLPFVLLLLDYWPLKRVHASPESSGETSSLILMEKVPLILLAAAAGVATFLIQDQAGAVGDVAVFTPEIRAANAVLSYALYLQRILWPSELAVLYPFPPAIPVWKAGLAGFVLLGITVAAAVQVRRRTYLPVGWLWFMGTLVPVIGIVPVGLQAMADRYTYIPMTGIAIMIAWGVPALPAGRRIHRFFPMAAAVAWIAVLAGVARVQVGYWKDSATLLKQTIAVTKDNYAAHTNLGIVYAGQGRVEEAIEAYRNALRIRSGFAKAHNNLGVALAGEGRLDEASVHYAEALKTDPGFAEAHYNLGLLLERRGKTEQAAVRYNRALHIDPALPEAHYRLGNLAAGSGRLTEAENRYRNALKANPRMVEAHHHLGNVLLEQGRLPEAAASFTRALKIEPGNARVHNNLGIALAGMGRFAKAEKHFRRALQIEPGDPEARRNLEKAVDLRKKSGRKP